jgi:DNA repair exonuclease SbcCD ATPase subunit
LVDELQEISEQKQREKDRIAQLEKQLEEKDERIEELEDEVEQAEQISDMAEKFQDNLMQSISGGSANDDAIQEKLDELREEKNRRIRELEQENKQYQKRINKLETKVDELEEYEEYRDKVEEWEEKRDVVQEALLRLKDELDIDVNEDTEKYRKRIKQQEQKIEELKEKVENGTVRDQSDFIGSERYNRILESIANRSKGREESYDTLMKELQVQPATPSQLANAVGLAKKTITSRYLPALKKQDWIEKSGDKYALTEDLQS